MRTKRRVILITDGDYVAAKTVKVVAEKVGGTCVMASRGNPTPLTGKQIVELIKKAEKEPVLVMVDDRGEAGKGKGESVLEYVVNHPELEVLGAVAVASNSDTDNGVEVDFSIDKDGNRIEGPVDKCGCSEPKGHRFLEGDTIEILESLQVPIVIGTGDTGKMQGKDDWRQGAEITTQAVREIIARSEK